MNKWLLSDEEIRETQYAAFKRHGEIGATPLPEIYAEIALAQARHIWKYGHRGCDNFTHRWVMLGFVSPNRFDCPDCLVEFEALWRSAADRI